MKKMQCVKWFTPGWEEMIVDSRMWEMVERGGCLRVEWEEI